MLVESGFVTPTRTHSLAGLAALVLFVSVVPTCASAETIRLKNGRIILADRVREVDGRVEYTIGDNTFAIPKSAVVSIDTGGTPHVTRRDDLPAPPVVPKDETLEPEGKLNAQVVVNGKVDQAALTSVELEGNADKAAVANFMAARHERTNGSPEKAERFIRRARTFLPQQDVLMTHHASILLQLGRHVEAAAVAEQATRVMPTSATGYALLGYANLHLNKTKAAIRALQRSLELQPDGSVEELLKKAEREAKAEAEFRQDDSTHFALRYEGAQASPELRRQILDTLERHYTQL